MAGILLNCLFALSGLLAARVLIEGFAGARAAAARLRSELARAEMPRDLYITVRRIEVAAARRRGERPAPRMVRTPQRRRASARPALPVAA